MRFTVLGTGSDCCPLSKNGKCPKRENCFLHEITAVDFTDDSLWIYGDVGRGHDDFDLDYFSYRFVFAIDGGGDKIFFIES